MFYNLHVGGKSRPTTRFLVGSAGGKGWKDYESSISKGRGVQCGKSWASAKIHESSKPSCSDLFERIDRRQLGFDS